MKDLSKTAWITFHRHPLSFGQIFLLAKPPGVSAEGVPEPGLGSSNPDNAELPRVAPQSDIKALQPGNPRYDRGISTRPGLGK